MMITKHHVNAYLAIFLITMLGSIASISIIKVAEKVSNSTFTTQDLLAELDKTPTRP